MAKKHFILGGSNSGKSRFAEQTALDIKKKLLSIKVKEIQNLKL